MYKKIVAFVFAAALLVAMAVPLFSGVGTASAHVHGITPLLKLSCKVDNSITGAFRADDGPAGAANGGPLTGLIPRDVGNASLTPMVDGGFNAPVTVCD